MYASIAAAPPSSSEAAAVEAVAGDAANVRQLAEEVIDGVPVTDAVRDALLNPESPWRDNGSPRSKHLRKSMEENGEGEEDDEVLDYPVDEHASIRSADSVII